MPESWNDMFFIVLGMIPLYKYTYKPINEPIEKYISGSAQFRDMFNDKGTTDIIATAYMPIYMNGLYVINLKDLFVEAGLDITDFDKVFTPITEEEFYDLNKWSLEDYK